MGTLKEIIHLIKNGPEKQSPEITDDRVKRLIDRVSQASPTGKKILDEALAKGTYICMDPDLGERWGVYIPDTNTIALDEKASSYILLSTLVHEARHACQTVSSYERGYNTKSAIAVERALEADAMAHQCTAVHEMRKAELSTYSHFQLEHGKIMEAFEEQYAQSGDLTQAMGGAFKAWYDSSAYIAHYDKKALGFMACCANVKHAYKTDMPGETLAEKIAQSDGRSYVDAAFFSSRQAMTVSAQVADAAEKIEKNHMRHWFKKAKSTSADFLYVREESGKIREPRRSESHDLTVAALAAKGKLLKGR